MGAVYASGEEFHTGGYWSGNCFKRTHEGLGCCLEAASVPGQSGVIQFVMFSESEQLCSCLVWMRWVSLYIPIQNKPSAIEEKEVRNRLGYIITQLLH